MAKPDPIFPTAAELSTSNEDEVLFTSKQAKWDWIKKHEMAEVVLAFSEAFGKLENVTCYRQRQDRSKS